MAGDQLYRGPDMSKVDQKPSKLGEYTAADQARGFGIKIEEGDIEVEVGGVFLPLPVAKALAEQEAKIVG